MAEEKKRKPGASKLMGGFIWAFAQLGVEWFVYPEGTMSKAISAAFGGFVAGWVTTGLLNTLARWGVAGKALFALGIVAGVAVLSGAFHGLSAALTWYKTRSLEIDWAKLQTFLLSWSVLPAAVLGGIAGLYVRSKQPAPKKK